MISTALKTVHTRGGVILPISFPNNIIVLEALLFRFFQIMINYMLSTTVPILSMRLVAYKERRFSLFRFLFGFISGSFQPVFVYYGLFWIVHLLQPTT